MLSASVMFTSLPGLDDTCRLAGYVAIVLSASSMMSAIVALFRYKTEVEHPIDHAGGEGLLLISVRLVSLLLVFCAYSIQSWQRRSILMSLPLVFLIWAVAAFTTGVVLYWTHQVTLTTSISTVYPFESQTHWLTVGIVGGVAGAICMGAMMTR